MTFSESLLAFFFLMEKQKDDHSEESIVIINLSFVLIIIHFQARVLLQLRS